MSDNRLLDLFLELVRIESPSQHEAPMALRCEQELHDLGFSVHFDNSQEQTGSEVGNLIAHLSGTAPGCLILSGHMDTVEPCAGIEPVVKDGVVRSAGDTILSADDKAAVAAIFEALRRFVDSGEPRPDITVVLSTCEELGVVGADALSPDELPAGAPCYVFDADGAPGSIIIGAPTHYTFHAVFSGYPAHAGVEPEIGISAIQMAASAIDAMELGRLDDSTTANIGVIEGGHEVNIVPESCMVGGECRSLDLDRVEEVRAAMTTALEQAAARFGGKVEITWVQDYKSVLYDKNDPLVQGIAHAAEAAGLQPEYHCSGGGADANAFAAHGVRAITLGTGMTNFHSVDEFITVDDLEGLARLIEALIRENVQA